MKKINQKKIGDWWGNIHEDFSKKEKQKEQKARLLKEKNDNNRTYQQIWEGLGLTCQDARRWIEIGFKPDEYEKVKEWKTHNFTSQEVKSWINVDGLNREDAEFVIYLRGKDYKPDDLKEKLKPLRKEYDNWLKKPKPAQEYLDAIYHPKNHERNDIKELCLSNKNLTGALNISDFRNLKELWCCKNKLTSLNFGNKDSNNNCLELRKLSCYNNDFSRAKLDIFSKLINLELLDIGNFNNEEQINQGAYNRFYGSLEPLKGIKKLKTLRIDGTDIDSSLEYLPDSLEEFSCSAEERKDAKCQNIFNLFANVGIEIEVEANSYGEIKDFLQKFQVYKEKLAEKRKEARQTSKKDQKIQKLLSEQEKFKTQLIRTKSLSPTSRGSKQDLNREIYLLKEQLKQLKEEKLKQRNEFEKKLDKLKQKNVNLEKGLETEKKLRNALKQEYEKLQKVSDRKAQLKEVIKNKVIEVEKLKQKLKELDDNKKEEVDKLKNKLEKEQKELIGLENQKSEVEGEEGTIKNTIELLRKGPTKIREKLEEGVDEVREKLRKQDQKGYQNTKEWKWLESISKKHDLLSEAKDKNNFLQVKNEIGKSIESIMEESICGLTLTRKVDAGKVITIIKEQSSDLVKLWEALRKLDKIEEQQQEAEKKIEIKSKEIIELENQLKEFESKDKKISLLEEQVQGLINKGGKQKEKIRQMFLNNRSEKELVRKLITACLKFKKAEKQEADDYLNLEEQYVKIKKELGEKLGGVKKIQPILSDCEELVSWELKWEFELEEGFKDKTSLIEEQKQALKQIAYNPENEKIVKNHEKVNQEQNEKIQELKLELAKIKGQILMLATKPTHQTNIYDSNINQLASGNNATFNNQNTYQQLTNELEKQITKPLTNQKITPQDQKIINQTIIFLGTKELFINYRQAVLNHLIDCYCKLAGKNKITKSTAANFNSVMGITSKLTKVIPKVGTAETPLGVLGDTINLASTIVQEKKLDKCLKKFQEVFIRDKSSLNLFDENYQSLEKIVWPNKQSELVKEIIKTLDLSEAQSYPFSSNHDVFKIGEVWEQGFSNLDLSGLKTFLEKLDKNLESYRKEFQQQRKQLAEQEWFKAVEEKTDLLREKSQVQILQNQLGLLENKSQESQISTKWTSANWQNIHPNFTEELQKGWESKGFNYEQARDWINIGLIPQDVEFTHFLKNTKQLTPKKALDNENIENLRQEFQQSQQNVQVIEDQSQFDLTSLVKTIKEIEIEQEQQAQIQQAEIPKPWNNNN